MNGWLVPANTKKAMLIANMLRPIDAIILGTGIGISTIFLLLLGNSGTLLLVLACVPMLIALILVLPIPNYHNTLVAIQSILNYYNERRNYIWRGWCMKDEFDEKK